MNTHSKLKAGRAAKSNVIVNVLYGCKLEGMITREIIAFGNIQNPVFKIVDYRIFTGKNFSSVQEFVKINSWLLLNFVIYLNS